ncbi:zinc metallopeptidase [Pirellulaceae bacterium SH467]|jgi:Zn-dependent membrane protease YugP
MLTYFLFLVPPMLLALLAQWMVQSRYRAMSQVPARLSGAEAARRILDANGLYDVPIEQSHGHLSDHYDPSAKVVRLSPEVYQGHSMASVGIAAHEVGHAIQDAKSYAPLVIRNLAVPIAGFGSSIASILMMAAFGLLMAGLSKLALPFMLIAIVGFSAVVVFQVVNLPVEFNASTRAKNELVGLGLIGPSELPYVSKVLNAAALTYVAATLQSVAQVAYYVLQFLLISGAGQSNRDS